MEFIIDTFSILEMRFVMHEDWPPLPDLCQQGLSPLGTSFSITQGFKIQYWNVVILFLMDEQ